VIAKIENMMQERQRLAHSLDTISAQLGLTQTQLYNDWISTENLTVGGTGSDSGIDLELKMQSADKTTRR
jgi:hypothetical protein